GRPHRRRRRRNRDHRVTATSVGAATCRRRGVSSPSKTTGNGRDSGIFAANPQPGRLSRKKCDKGNELRYVSAPARVGRASRGVAQLAERRSPKPKVGGSRPSAPANYWFAPIEAKATPVRALQQQNK